MKVFHRISLFIFIIIITTVKYADGTLAPVDPTVPAATAPFGVKKVAITVVHTATSITSVAFAASSENFQPGMTITIAAGALGASSTEVSFRILKEYMAGTEIVTLTDNINYNNTIL